MVFKKVKEDPATLKRIINISNNIRRKYRNLKRGLVETEHELEKTFKPITQPLKKLIKLEKGQDEYVKLEPKTPKPELAAAAEQTFMTPRTFNFLDDDDDDPLAVEEEGAVGGPSFLTEYDDDDDDNQELVRKFGSIAAKYIHFYDTNERERENVYGIHRNIKTGDWFIGNTKIEINQNDIRVKDEKFPGTVGLYELLVKKSPTSYTESDLDNYIKILIKTNALRRGYDPIGQLHGNPSKKYREIIKPVILSKKEGYISGSGNSIPTSLTVNDRKYNYVYWDDPNELVVRLRILIASKEAGHSNLDNEILAILEELRENDIIV